MRMQCTMMSRTEFVHVLLCMFVGMVDSEISDLKQAEVSGGIWFPPGFSLHFKEEMGLNLMRD